MVKYGSLPFDAQLAFFKKKLALPTRGWTDIIHGNHDHAFAVAGANRMALVEDFQTSVQKAIADGTTLESFRKDFDRIVEDHGWDYNGKRGWRSRVIYETNIRSSYQAGRYTRLQQMEFWQYHHSPASENARQQHVQWDGLILPKDDPFWDTNYPPNGFGCRCTVTGHSKAAVKRKGLKVADSPKLEMQTVTIGTRGPNPRKVQVPKGVGPGWAYPPGRDAWMHTQSLRASDASPFPFDQTGKHDFKVVPERGAPDLMQDPRSFPKDKLLPPMPRGQDEKYARLFLKQFKADAGKPAIFTDVSGEAVVISDAMFKNDSGRWKMGKGTRSAQLNMLADSLKHPDEIWTWVEWHRKEATAMTSRAYVSRYIVDGEQHLALIIMQRGSGTWEGTTVHTSGSSDDFNQKVDKNRRGVRLYRRTGK